MPVEIIARRSLDGDLKEKYKKETNKQKKVKKKLRTTKKW